MIALLALSLSAGATEATLSTGGVPAALSDALRTEMARASELSLPEAPPLYHLRYHLVQMDQLGLQASFGGLVYQTADPYNALGVELRIGDPSFDNTGFGGWQDGFDRMGLPARLTPAALRFDTWRLTDRAYKQAVEQYARKQAQFTPPADYPGDYTLTGPTVHDGGAGTVGDADALRSLALRMSAAMIGGSHPLEQGAVHVGHEAGWVWTVDTEGTSVRRPMRETTLRAVGHLRTKDGMLLTDHRLWTVAEPGDLPSAERMVAEAAKLRSDLQKLADAPTFDDEYVGPVLFEDSAAADLFRYVLLPQFEGTPPEIPFDSWFGDLGRDKDPVRLGRRVLPVGWSVTDDPTRMPDHAGAFTHDWEGTPARAVRTVSDGIVQELLMSRVPRKGVEGTTGHGRGYLGSRAEGRASLTEVVPRDRSSVTKLRKQALKLAKSYGRDWVVVVRRLQEPAARNAGTRSGFLMLGGDDKPSHLPPPMAVIKLYADGREEVFRGAAFASVERWILRDIMGAGPQVEASYLAPVDGGYGSLGPTEGLPAWISAPEVLIGEAELVPMPGDPSGVPLLPPPAVKAASAGAGPQ